MSDGQINEVSMKLGQLLSESAEAKRVRDRLFEKLDDTNTRLVETIGVLKQHIEEDKRVETRLTTIEKQVTDAVLPHVRSMQDIKARGLWILGVLAAIGGSAGTGIGTVLKKLVSE